MNVDLVYLMMTPDMRQSKTLLTIDERGSKTARNSVFNCHLSPVGRQMAIENSVSNDFLATFVDSINVFNCRLSGVCIAKLNLNTEMGIHKSYSYRQMSRRCPAQWPWGEIPGSRIRVCLLGIERLSCPQRQGPGPTWPSKPILPSCCTL